MIEPFYYQPKAADNGGD